MRLLLLSLLFGYAAGATAVPAERVQRFPLNQPINEPQIIACLDADVPRKLNRLMAQGKEKEAGAELARAVGERVCGIGSATVTYVRRIARLEARGVLYTVYEGRLSEGLTLFIPMIGFEHEVVEG